MSRKTTLAPVLAPRIAALASLVLACSTVDAGGSGTDAGTTGVDTGDPPTGGATDDLPFPPGEGAEGWQKAFSAEPAGIHCAMDEAMMLAAGAPHLTFGTSSIYIGFEQDGQNQDPVFARFDSGVQVYCEHHEQEGPDGRAYGLTWDGGPVAYVVYTIVGGGSAFDSKGQGGWLDRYGDGGGSAKVSFIGEVETEFGALVRGTFVIARKMDGKTNTHNPADAVTVLAGGGLEFRGESAFQPMNPDRTIMECTDYPFHTRYVFSADLATLQCSSSTNCVSQVPCP